LTQEERKKLVALSHRFGTPEFVVGGGGNSSVKDVETLWVKPSGTSLATLTPASLLPLDRAAVAAVGQMALPDDASEREDLVMQGLQRAVRRETDRRPTVESLLHNTLERTYVVHTHPAAVNGMTCAREGAEFCRRTFPAALWIPYVDPGCTLSARVSADVAGYRRRGGGEPEAIVLENHGIFVGGDTPEAVTRTYDRFLGALAAAYAQRGIPTSLAVGPPPDPDEAREVLTALSAAVGGERPVHIAPSGPFPVPPGSISPDHLIFMKAEALRAEPTAEALAAYRAVHGFDPRVLVTDTAVYGLGATPRDADLSLAVARDAALVVQLADAFGGVKILGRAAREFLENWEMEVYRQKVAATA